MLLYLPKKMWGLGFILISAIALVSFIILTRFAKPTATNRLLQEQQTFTRAQAANITSFFESFGNSVAILAQLSTIKDPDQSTQRDMDAFVEQWRESGLVGGVILTDTNGVVQLNANSLHVTDTGASIADLDYFAWAQTHPGEGEYFVNQPITGRIGTARGHLIVPVASPVYQDEEFKGIVAASVKLEPLTERFLSALKVSDATKVYLVDQQNQPLYNQAKPDPAADLITSAPISLGNQTWQIITATPIQEVANLTRPLFIRQISLLLFVSVNLFLFGILVSKNARL